jgi:hypothetical protein
MLSGNKRGALFFGRRRFGAVAVVTFAAGCMGNPFSTFRGQTPDSSFTDLESDSLTSVGQLTSPTGMNTTMVRGVGLVTGLKNTGGNPPPSNYKEQLFNEMAAYDVDKPHKVLASKSTALVTVHGYLHPGIQRGERFDIFVNVPNRSDTTSLRKGKLLPTRLKTVAIMENTIKEGHVDARGRGLVLADAVFKNSDNEKDLIKGRVLGGGVCSTNRSLGLRVNKAAASIAASTVISNAVNLRFSHYVGSERKGVADPKTPGLIELAVPSRYRHNIHRYMRVVRAIPVRISANDRILLLKELELELLEPTSTAQAALKLEALGECSTEVLRLGVESNDIEVRFYSAEALAYLDDENVAPILAQIGAQERAFRWHALAALAAIRHVSSYEALTQLLNHPSAETRYGAFRAMKARNPRDPLIRGEVLRGKLVLHELPDGGEPMIHFANSRSAEIVLFGTQQRLHTPNFLFVGRRMMIKRLDDQRVRVIKFSPGEDDEELVTSNRLGDVIRTIVELDGGYEEVYQAFRSAKLTGKLSSRMEVDSQARAGRRYQRDTSGSGGKFRAANPIPSLYRSTPEPGDEEQGDNFSDLDVSTEADRGFFGKMKSLISRKEPGN